VAQVEGLFSIPEGGHASVELGTFAETQATAILMPFVREALASATVKSRFGPLLLPPINVAALVAEMKGAKKS
jgi:preprotein translocase subunit SecB